MAPPLRAAAAFLTLTIIHLSSSLDDQTAPDAKCDPGGFDYIRRNYDQCCGYGRFKRRPEVCEAAKPSPEEDERTPSYPKVPKTPTKMPPACNACARMIDNFEMGLLPRLAERHKQLLRHHSRSKFAASATVGELEAIVEEEVERICTWPRTHHQRDLRKACNRLVEERADELVNAISSFARDGKYGMDLGEALSEELRPALCQEAMGLCTGAQIDELIELDADEAAKIRAANDTGYTEERPLESEHPSKAKEGALLALSARTLWSGSSRRARRPTG